jgi:hypothetical protein
MPKRIFISHDSAATKEAVWFTELLKAACGSDLSIFLSSDWDSLNSGEAWSHRIFEELRNCDELIALITSRETFSRLWINFEIGAFVGRNRNPKIFVFGAIPPWQEIPRPIADLQLTDTGNTNRWMRDLQKIGIDIDERTQCYLVQIHMKGTKFLSLRFSKEKGRASTLRTWRVPPPNSERQTPNAKLRTPNSFHNHLLCLGSRASRRPSPRKFRARSVNDMAMAGNTNSHQ